VKNIKLVSVIGARPQFIKAAPIEMELLRHPDIEHYSIHTGQHYDNNMSDIFFKQLGLQLPFKNLNAGSGTHAQQTANIMTSLEPLLQQIEPDMLLVYGDTNSTLAAALVASKLHIPVAHIEAGLRSFNKTMPEEINRIVTDHISSLLFVPTDTGMDNLKREGLENAIKTGDVMMDMIEIAKSKEIIKNPSVQKFCYATIHRPYNTDNKERLLSILESMNGLDIQVIFSLHPRTRNLLKGYDIDLSNYKNISFIEPQGYFENLAYLTFSEYLVTDSGGMQKEAYFLEKRCITLRSETEWTETLENQCNVLLWENPAEIANVAKMSIGPFHSNIYGNGHASEEIVSNLKHYFSNRSVKS
jgi:UDP-GlcNAc3NAcA epimerase